MKISASIVIYNPDIEWLSLSINSFMNSNIENKILYLIDNSEETLNELSLFESKELIYIHTNKNIGFGAGHNIAIRKAIENNMDFHLILNPDVKFNPDVISILISYLNNHKDIGIIAPKLYYDDGSEQKVCRLLPYPKDLFIRRFIPIKKIRDRITQKSQLLFYNYKTIEDIPIIPGCFLLARVDALKLINGFDERFFMYMEDFDLCRRNLKNFRNVFYANVGIIHKSSKESYVNNKLLLFHTISAFKYFTKWGWIFDKERRLINKRTLSKLIPKKIS